MTSRAAVDGTLWRIVRAIHLRVAGKLSKRDLLRESVDAQELALEPFHRDMESDVRALLAVTTEARRSAIELYHARMHAHEDADHEMIDQAASIAAEGWPR